MHVGRSRPADCRRARAGDDGPTAAVAAAGLGHAQAGPGAAAAVNNGLAWLVQQVEAGGLHQPTPIGFYFAKLWYFEKLYPIIFTVAALGTARRKLSGRHPLTSREHSP